MIDKTKKVSHINNPSDRNQANGRGLFEKVRRRTIAVPLAAIALTGTGCQEFWIATIEKDKPARVEGRFMEGKNVGNDQDLIEETVRQFVESHGGLTPVPGGVPVGGGLFLGGGNSRLNYNLLVDQCELSQDAVHENCEDAYVEVSRETFIEHPVGSYITFERDLREDAVSR